MSGSVVELRMSNGVRQAMLIGVDGIPVYYPNLYVTTVLRHKTKETQKDQLFYIRQLYEWSEIENVDFERRFRSNAHLTELEVIGLIEFCAWSAETIGKLKSKASMLPTAYVQTGKDTFKKRMLYFQSYLEFLYNRLSSNTSKQSDIDAVRATFKTYRPKFRPASTVAPKVKKIDDKQLDLIFEKLLPGHPDNPWVSKDVQVRNLLIIHILNSTGFRQGEVAALYVSDIQDCKISVYRRHNDPNDKRTNQPSAKTLERTLPIDEDVMELYLNYVMQVRSQYPVAKKHPYLFVNYRVNKGEPMQRAAINQLFVDIRNMFPELKGLTSHVFRHHMNYTISKYIDKAYAHLSPEERASHDESMRPSFMGHSPNSKTQRVYNTRYYNEKADEFMKSRANRLNRKDSDDS